MNKFLKFGFVFLILFFCSISAFPQKKDRIRYKADDLFEFKKEGEKIRHLINNVVFTQENTTMYCDSSYYYVSNNIMEAFGRVKIVDDSVTIISDKLIYDGQGRIAKLRENVVYTKGDQQLSTDFLDYNMDTETGIYLNGGRLEDSVNVLTSETGYYYGLQRYALFWDSVELIAPHYTLRSDTLKYNFVSKIAITEGNTTIITKDESILHAKEGTFRTQSEQSEFIDGTVETTDYYMKGDNFFFDDLKKYYFAKGNVKLTGKNENVVITGNEGYSDKKNGISKVYGNALMKRFFKKDTLYIVADTLVSIESKYDSAKRILAYHNVKIWKVDLQGLADSVSYRLKDSLLFFYKNPVLWNLNNQFQGDTIMIEITEKDIKSMLLLQNAFFAIEDTLKHYNQIKGRIMEAIFKESKISHIDVNGNGESIYYVLDQDDPDEIIPLGMNRILCSNMTLRFKDEKLNNISFYINPKAQFIPPDEWTEEGQKLRGFEWMGHRRPSLDDLLVDTSTLTRNEEPSDKSPQNQKKYFKHRNTPENENKMLKSIKEDMP